MGFLHGFLYEYVNLMRLYWGELITCMFSGSKTDNSLLQSNKRQSNKRYYEILVTHVF